MAQPARWEAFHWSFGCLLVPLCFESPAFLDVTFESQK